MRILANENIPREAVERLRSHGHDVAWVRRDSPGSGDRDILGRVAAEERVMVTFDKEFSELAYATGLPASAGVILLRFAPASPATITQRTAEILESRDDWAGHFSVVEETLVRMLPLPSTGGRR